MSERALRVRDHLMTAEIAVAEFVASSGLACPPGCGACCLSPHVTATAVELDPMAETLVRVGRASAVLDAIRAIAAAPGEGSPCVMYVPEAGDPRRGRCSAYADRPLVCRLFGFAARRGREGAKELMTCSTLAAAEPERTAAARRVPLLDLAPVMSDHAQGLAAEFTSEGAAQRPINEALREALERALLRLWLGADEGSGGGAETDDDGGAPAPPRAAA